MLKFNSITLLLFLSLINCSLVYSTPKHNENSLLKADTARSGKVRTYRTVRLTTELPQIDGKLDDKCWQTTGAWAGDFIQWIPAEGGKPSQPTNVKILYDDNNLYVAIRAFDSEPDKIIRTAGRRDEFAGDAVGICLDSYHDHRTGFEFDITAGGQKVDLILTNPMNADYSWDAVWYAKTGQEDSAWVAEMQIPLSQLRYSSDHEQVWGMHVWRWLDRVHEESDWEPQTSTGPGMLYLFGELHGISGLPKSRRIEILPYTLGKLNTFPRQPGNPFAEKGREWNNNLGLDAKIGLSNNFTLNLTVNPDFGQVEADPSNMNLTAFETFYDEKRPFFLEGKNIFSFDADDASIFYSRRIGHSAAYHPALSSGEYLKMPESTPILDAVKFSGKTSDGFSVGIIQSLTGRGEARIQTPSGEKTESVEPVTNYFIARLQQDYAEGNTVLGGIFTSTNRFIKDKHLEYLNKGAYTGGIDFLHQFNDKEYYLNASVFGSHIQGSTQSIMALQNSSARYFQRPDADYLEADSSRTSLSGIGGKIKFGKGSKGLWRYSTELKWNSPGLELNDLGFMQVADIIRQENSVSFSINEPFSIFRTFGIWASEENNWNFGGEYLWSEINAGFNFDLENLWSVRVNGEYSTEVLDTRLLRGGEAFIIPADYDVSFYLGTNPVKMFHFYINAGTGNTVNNKSGFYRLAPGMVFRPLNNLKFSLDAEYYNNTDALQYMDMQTAGTRMSYFLAKLDQEVLSLTFRADWHISPELSVQYYGSPFSALIRYSDYKLVTEPKAGDFDGRFFSFRNPALVNNQYLLDMNSDGAADYRINKGDFNFGQFRSNLVLRWEYTAGSQLYFVWASETTNNYQPQFTLPETINKMKQSNLNNIFLIKFNYWFTL